MFLLRRCCSGHSEVALVQVSAVVDFRETFHSSVDFKTKSSWAPPGELNICQTSPSPQSHNFLLLLLYLLHFFSFQSFTSCLSHEQQEITFLCVCLLTKRFINQLVDFIERIKKQSIDKLLKVSNFWSWPHSKWLPQIIELGQHRNGYTPVGFTDTDLKCEKELAETRPNRLYKC